jgi:archaellum component FlaC
MYRTGELERLYNVIIPQIKTSIQKLSQRLDNAIKGKVFEAQLQMMCNSVAPSAAVTRASSPVQEIVQQPTHELVSQQEFNAQQQLTTQIKEEIDSIIKRVEKLHDTVTEHSSTLKQFAVAVEEKYDEAMDDVDEKIDEVHEKIKLENKSWRSSMSLIENKFETCEQEVNNLDSAIDDVLETVESLGQTVRLLTTSMEKFTSLTVGEIIGKTFKKYNTEFYICNGKEYVIDENYQIASQYADTIYVETFTRSRTSNIPSLISLFDDIDICLMKKLMLGTGCRVIDLINYNTKFPSMNRLEEVHINMSFGNCDTTKLTDEQLKEIRTRLGLRNENTDELPGEQKIRLYINKAPGDFIVEPMKTQIANIKRIFPEELCSEIIFY